MLPPTSLQGLQGNIRDTTRPVSLDASFPAATEQSRSQLAIIRRLMVNDLIEAIRRFSTRPRRPSRHRQ
jgi:hypothetical protein